MVLWNRQKEPVWGAILRFLADFHPVRALTGWVLGGKAQLSKHLTRGVDMNEVTMLRGDEPRKILQVVIEKKTPAIMSYLSRRKWYVAKVVLTNLGANRLEVQLLPRKTPHPLNICVNQPVGVSLKYEYGKFIFETTVTALEPAACAGAATVIPAEAGTTSGGTIVLRVPDRIEIVQRRSYFRVDVPKSLKVNVLLWHRSTKTMDVEQEMADVPEAEGGQSLPKNYWQGRLTDISAGGAQVVVDAAQNPDFKKGQFIGMRFTPVPYETPLMFSAQIRNTLPTADNKGICIGLQIVGLEASPEGRQVLQRLCSVVERYYQINQSSAKQQDLRTTRVSTRRGL